MGEYRIRHTDTDLEGVVGTFENDREAVAWWFDYAHQHPAVQAWEIVLERDDGGRRWASVATQETRRHLTAQPATTSEMHFGRAVEDPAGGVSEDAGEEPLED